MKANVRKTTADILAVRGVALPFNSLNERDLRREAEAEKLIEEKHPGAMDILNMKVGLDDVKDGIEVADLFEREERCTVLANDLAVVQDFVSQHGNRGKPL